MGTSPRSSCRRRSRLAQRRSDRRLRRHLCRHPCLHLRASLSSSSSSSKSNARAQQLRWQQRQRQQQRRRLQRPGHVQLHWPWRRLCQQQHRQPRQQHLPSHLHCLPCQWCLPAGPRPGLIRWACWLRCCPCPRRRCRWQAPPGWPAGLGCRCRSWLPPRCPWPRRHPHRRLCSPPLLREPPPGLQQTPLRPRLQLLASSFGRKRRRTRCSSSSSHRAASWQAQAQAVGHCLVPPASLALLLPQPWHLRHTARRHPLPRHGTRPLLPRAAAPHHPRHPQRHRMGMPRGLGSHLGWRSL